MKKFRYLTEFLFAFIFLKFLQLLPLKTSSNIGGFLGKNLLFIAGFFTGDNKKGLRQIGIVFSEMTESEKLKILKKSYSNIGRFVAEYINQQKMNERWFKENVAIENGEYFLEMAQKGAFMMTAHFGNWEIAQRFLVLHKMDLNVIYNPITNNYINSLYLKQRSITQLPKGTNAMKQLIELIKAKKNIGVVADQRDKAGEIMKFFNHDARTSTAIQRLAVKYDYPIFAVKCERRKDDENKFVMTIYKMFETQEKLPEKAIKDLTAQNLALTEKWIRASPENWLLWFYSRWRIHF